MRVLVIAFAAWLLVPAAASAQSIIAQDLSITGAVVASPAPLVRKVRFTVKNNGPGTVTQHTYVVVERFGLMEIVSAPGCTIRTVAGSTLDARCELGQSLAEGATRTIDVTVRFTDIDFTRDQVRGTVHASNTVGGQGLGDQNGINNQAIVDLGLVAPPPAMKLEVFLPALLQHGVPIRGAYGVTNTGGVMLTDVRVTDDACATPRSTNGLTSIRPLGGIVSTLTFVCDLTVPRHRKGEKPPVHHVTATARAGSQVLTVRRTVRSQYGEPQRECGSLKVKGKTYDATTVRPDVGCKKVRRQLAKCLRVHKAPKGFRCRTYNKGKLAWLRPKPFKGVDWMRAARR